MLMLKHLEYFANFAIFVREPSSAYRLDHVFPRASFCTEQEVLSDLASILEHEVAAGVQGAGKGGTGVAEGALTAAVHLLQWDEQVVGITIFLSWTSLLFLQIVV